MASMANYWSSQGRIITFLVLADDEAEPFFDLDGRIRYIPLGITGDSPHAVAGAWNNLRRVCALRKAVRESRPDVVISFIDQVNVLTLLATFGLDLRVIVSERIDPNVYRISNVWKCLRWFVYPRADRIVVQTRGALAYFLPKFQGRAVVIPNPVLVPETQKGDCTAGAWSTGPSIIAAGRLAEQKHFDLLLRAFARLKDQYPEWTLTILGEGPMRSMLEALCVQLRLTDRVFLPGFVKTPQDYLKQASLFVMSSLFEGFPNALCEAMACGLPVISTACTDGLREIIRDEQDCIIVPPDDEDALVSAMARLMSNEAERQRLAHRAVEIVDRFSLGKVMEMWEEVLNGVMGKQLT